MCMENLYNVFAPVKACNEVITDKQEVEWIVHRSLASCLDAQDWLPLILEKCASMNWVLQRIILTEDVVVVLLHRWIVTVTVLL